MTGKMRLTDGGHDFTGKGERCRKCGIAWAEFDRSGTTCLEKKAAEPIRGLTVEE